MPFGLQPTHLIIILVVALLIFGPSRLPEIGRSFGTMMREFRSATKEATQSLSEASAPTPAPREQVTTIPCKKCGKPIQPGMKFCPECGGAQDEVAPAT